MKVSPSTPDAEVDARPAADVLADAFARYQDELVGTLYYVVGNVEDARDALQECFLKCWKHRAELDTIENLKAWVFRIALNTGRDIRTTAWRRRRTPLVGEQNMLATKNPGPHACLEHDEDLSRLRRAVADLRNEEQEVFLLRQNAQMSYEEIAQSIGIPLGTVKTRMRLALEKLRLALGTA
jgi:RNA polymerase sigma-70 factor (ECF subfamily)